MYLLCILVCMLSPPTFFCNDKTCLLYYGCILFRFQSVPLVNNLCLLSVLVFRFRHAHVPMKIAMWKSPLLVFPFTSIFPKLGAHAPFSLPM